MYQAVPNPGMALNHAIDPHVDRACVLAGPSWASGRGFDVLFQFGPFDAADGGAGRFARRLLGALSGDAKPSGLRLLDMVDPKGLRWLQTETGEHLPVAGDPARALRRLDGDADAAAGGPARRAFDGGQATWLFAAGWLGLGAGGDPRRAAEHLRSVIAEAWENGLAGVSLSRRLGAQAGSAISAARATRVALRKVAPEGFDGRGVLVGAVDFGCLWDDPAFRDGDRRRIVALWDQNRHGDHARGGETPPDYGYGRAFTGDAVGGSGYDCFDNYYTTERPDLPHGSAVLGVAAGGRAGAGVDARVATGVAPGADLAFVQVRMHEDAASGVRTLDADDVIDGIAYIFDQADQRKQPAVVNVSLNTSGGAHDAHTYFSKRLELLMARQRRDRARVVVVAAGNFADRKLHASGTIDCEAAAEAAFDWNVDAGDPSRNDLEIWYEAKGRRLTVILEGPHGETLGPVAPEALATVERDGELAGVMVGSRHQPRAGIDAAPSGEALETGSRHGRQAIVISLQPGGRAETWRVRLRPETEADGGGTVAFAAYLERDDYDLAPGTGRVISQSRLAGASVSEDDTLGALSYGPHAVCVAAVASMPELPPLPGLPGPLEPFKYWRYSSVGDSDGTPAKPDLAALGVDVHVGTDGAGNALALSGTSLAAPAVTGTLALMLQAAPGASREELVSVLKATARPIRRGPGNWHPRIGHGVVDAEAAIRKLREEQRRQ